jgi:hypothetical protein
MGFRVHKSHKFVGAFSEPPKHVNSQAATDSVLSDEDFLFKSLGIKTYQNSSSTKPTENAKSSSVKKRSRKSSLQIHQVASCSEDFF